MKQIFSILLACLMLVGCSTQSDENPTVPESNSVTEIVLSDDSIQVNGGDETAAVYTTHDIIYYKDRETYDSGNPYGEGTKEERHTEKEAAAHTVVNITKPGTYRVTGTLSAGQLRIDLGEDTYYDENAVVELILKDADITCTVAPAILFLNVYECDGYWDEDDAKADVDTSKAGANLILEGINHVSGSHVAKIFKDKDGEKKLWKQDAAIYSYMSMNISGSGALNLIADNEGLGSELHLTINGGNLNIYSDNDGINTNEDDVSVATINDGNVAIFAGLGKEGDGIDSNGYLVINGGRILSSANPKSDEGLDSALGSYVNGGIVVATGSTMNWAESDSRQVTMNLQFASQQSPGRKMTVTKEDGTEIFSFKNKGEHARSFTGLILSHPAFAQGETYQIYVDDIQMAYTGTDVGNGHGAEKPMNFPEDQQLPMPEGMEPPKDFEDGPPPEMPENFDPSQMPDRDPLTDQQGMMPPSPEGEAQIWFYMNDTVNAFSGVTAAK